MTNESNSKALIDAYKASNARYNEEPGTLPIKKGQILKFIDGGEGVGYKEYPWSNNGRSGKRMVLLCEGGVEVPVKQILRRGNGLGLSGTREQMLTEFIGRIDGNYSVTVVDTFKQESSYYDSKDVYLVFEEAPAAEA